MSPAEEIVVKLTAQAGDLNSGMDAAAAKVRAATDSMRASVAESMSQFAAFDAIQKGSIKTAQDVAAAQATLTAAQTSGAYTTEELAAKQAILDAAMAKLPAEMEAASAATTAFTANSRVMGEVSTIVSEAMSGNFGRIRRSAAALANQSGLLQSAFLFLISPAGMAAAAVAGVGIAAYEAGERIEQFQQALERSNDTSGLSATELSAIAERISNVTHEYDKASEAVRLLAADGRFTADQINDIALAMVQYAEGTGQDIKNVFSLMEQILGKPAEAADTLHEKMGILSQDQADQIKQLVSSGQKQEAINDLLQAFEQRAPKAFNDATKQAGSFSNALDTVSNKLGLILRDLGSVAERGFSGIDYAITGDKDAAGEYFNGPQDDSQAKIAAARSKKSASSGPTPGSFGALQQMGEQGVDLTGNLQSQLKALEAAQKVSYEERESFESEYWAYVLSKEQTGSAQYITAWQNLQQVDHDLMQKSAQAVTEAENKKQEAVRKSARVAIQAAHEAAQANDEMARHDQELMQQEVQQQIAGAQEAARASIAAAQGDYDVVADAIKAKFDLGQITAQQEIADLEQSEQRKYQIELAALQDELKLVQMKPEVAKRVNDQIEALERAHNLRMQQLSEQSAKDYQKTWQDRLKPVTQAFGQSINGMIQGTLTLKQAERNMLQSVLAEFIQSGIDMVAHGIANQEAQNAAAAAGAATRVTIAQTAAAETKTAEASTAQGQIMTAAATAAAKAYQAIVGIPYVGPILAPIAAGVAFAGVEAFTADIASAEGGWERVPADGMMTRLHYNEMVLPAHVAEPVRQMAKNGGKGGGGEIHHHHYSIQAYDTRGVGDLIRRRGKEISAAVQHLGRRGYRV